MFDQFIEGQIKAYVAGKTDAELLDMVERLVLPRFTPAQMVGLRDLLNEKIAAGEVGTVASPANTVEVQVPAADPVGDVFASYGYNRG